MTIYLDHAAKSWPKAPGVADAVAAWFDASGVSADRGDGSRQRPVAQRVAAARRGIARLAGVAKDHVAFTSGATESLNLVLRGLIRPGDRVVTTATEHSSVVRPLVAMRDSLDLDLKIVPCDATGRVDADELADAATTSQLLIANHASNVTGAIQDLGPAIRAAAAHGCLTVLDASQTLGVVPTAGLGCDFVVASAHKGLLAPPGLGFIAAKHPERLRQWKVGGSGSSSALETHPTAWPTAFEAGTPNTPAILGLAAALEWLEEHPAASEVAGAFIDELRHRLESLPDLRVHAPEPDQPHIPVLSVTSATMDPVELAMLLESHEIQTRAGYHCAPWIHRHLGTEQAGTLRFSAGPFVNAGDAARVAAAMNL